MAPVEPVELKRALNLPLLVLFGLGTILGAGIYVLVGKVAGVSGPHAPIAFLVAGTVAGFTAFTYAELAARYPKSAGEAIYAQEGFGSAPLSLAVGLLIVAGGLISSATLANGFVGYLGVFIGLPPWLVIAALVLALGAIAAWGIGESVAVAAAATLIEAAGLAIVIVSAWPEAETLKARLPEVLLPAGAAGWEGIALGAFLAFYAFIGFEDMVNVAEEVKNPQRTLPHAIVLVMVLATALYLLVAVVATLALPAAELSRAPAPLAMIYERSGGDPRVIALIGLFAVVNGALIQIIMGARVLYGMSRLGWLPRGLSKVDAARRTPIPATLLVTAVVLVLALWLPLVTLAKTTSAVLLVVFALMHASLIRIKRREPNPAGIRVYPAWVPIAGLVLTASMLIVEFVGVTPG